MKAMFHRILCLGLVLVLLLSVSACGEKGEPVSSSAESPALNSAENSPASGKTEALPEGGGEENPAVYNGLFDSSRVHSIDVTLSQADWEDLRANPLNKTKYEASVVIDGERLDQVSFATKGNTSLSSVASDPESDRYSFKLNFGKYDKNQSYHGLNKLSLNNLYADATYMKDYLSYGLFRRLGVEAPLVSYVWLTVNGADHGLYIAIEDVSESWLERTQEGAGVVYKPEAEGLDQAGGPQPGNQKDFPGGAGTQGGFPGGPGGFPGGAGQGMTPPGGQIEPMPQGEAPTPPEGQGEPMPQSFPGMGERDREGRGGPGFGDNAKGADLRYTDDEPSSYSDIFDNAETALDEGAEERVIAALKGLSEGRAEEVLDVDEVIRYFAAHNFVLNYDSYTGNMLHNYFLYERDGRLSMLPWDYNLAFGAFGGMGGDSDATRILNTGMDSPLSGAEADSRPMWAWIPENQEALEAYHRVMDGLLRDYFESGAFARELETLEVLLRPWVEKDPTAFYSPEEFDAAAETLRQVCLLRAASLRAQLEGRLAAVTEEQDPDARVDASGLSIAAMGTHMGGRGGFPGGEGNPDGQDGFPGGEGNPDGQDGFPGGEGNPDGQDGFPGGPGGPGGQTP